MMFMGSFFKAWNTSSFMLDDGVPKIYISDFFLSQLFFSNMKMETF
jgi:hypothetical protein